MILRSIVACAIAMGLLLAAVVNYRRRPSTSAGLLTLAAGSFVVVAVVHVFEALGIFSAAGWGQPASVGHYIDLAAALLGVALVCWATVTVLLRRRSK